MKLAKITNTQTGTVDVFEGTDTAWATRQGFTLTDVEQGPNGFWYLTGHAPIPQNTYQQQRAAAYDSIAEQLDKLYHDIDNGLFDNAAKTGQFYLHRKLVKETYPK